MSICLPDSEYLMPRKSEWRRLKKGDSGVSFFYNFSNPLGQTQLINQPPRLHSLRNHHSILLNISDDLLQCSLIPN
jgi:hypothetical protein